MLWLCVVAASTWFGYHVLALFRLNNVSFQVRILSAWFLGALATGVVFFATTLIMPISFLHTVAVVAGLVVSGTALAAKGHRTPIAIEKNVWYIFYMLFTMGVSLKYLAAIYRQTPYSGPSIMVPFLDNEVSFINSVLLGCNRRHFTNPFFYKNPSASGFNYEGYSLPLLYTAACMSLGASYGDASIVICFMNTVTAAAMMHLIARKLTSWATICSLLFLFSGSWAGFLYFRAANRMNISNDLVHQFQPTHQSVWYHTLGTMLSMSKSSSFAVAGALLAIVWAPSPLAGLFGALIPSTTTSFALFGLFSGFPNNIKTVLPFAGAVILKIFPVVFTYMPLFREAEMRGTFFAPLVIWFLALGPVFVVILLFFWVIPRGRLRHYLFSALGPFLLLQFFREGRDHWGNAIAITATFLPFVMICFTELMRRFASWPKDEEYQGCTLFVTTATFAFLLFGGYICLSRIRQSHTVFISNSDLDAAQWILRAVPKISKKAIILTRSKPMNPLILTGRQQFLGDKHLVWHRGINFGSKLDQIDLLLNGTVEEWNRCNIHYVLEEPSAGFAVSTSVQTLHENSNYRLATLT